jgi:hypothetical protein
VSQSDAVVVGAGPTGLACGIELQRRGLKAIILEKGCVVNSLYNYPTNMVFFTTPELMEIGGIPMTSLGEKATRTEALKYYVRVADFFKLDIRQYQRVEASPRRRRLRDAREGPAGAAHGTPLARLCSPRGVTTDNRLGIPARTQLWDVAVVGRTRSHRGAGVARGGRGPAHPPRRGVSRQVKCWWAKLDNRIKAGR